MGKNTRKRGNGIRQRNPRRFDERGPGDTDTCPANHTSSPAEIGLTEDPVEAASTDGMPTTECDDKTECGDIEHSLRIPLYPTYAILGAAWQECFDPQNGKFQFNGERILQVTRVYDS